ncbi:UDP-N-acetyl-D-mannosamine dehydrogenase [Stenotrophomonas sp. Iso1]|uniref:UDP-N-acetyl-D-mannosamine dehydrogenase n=1 Tax=Stenotrophomonas sp. Iso1 TaxID=2977283 RepID=UPI0022B7AF15|nr:UDP-N-acetyl-D-mannosamine dehydrogenase [Stenotrophomonas sp. Iso1]
MNDKNGAVDGVIGSRNERVISVIGLGYIGLPTAVTFAAHGRSVVGVDISERAVNSVNQGKAHIEEQGLSELVSEVVASGRLRAVTSPVTADEFIIAVPTPVDHETHLPDIGYVIAAGRSIASVLRKGNLVVLESTSPVGTTRKLAELLAELRPDLRFPLDGETDPDVYLAYCPERIIPGQMLRELIENDRIIGGMSEECTKHAIALYDTFVKGQCVASDDRTAELCKLAENSYRDVNIAFANELSMICGDLGIDVWKLVELANRHPRVNILKPGPGVGGHCIAVDPWFIVSSDPERAKIIKTARQVNDSKPGYVLDLVAAAVNKVNKLNGRPPQIVCLGLAYKPDVDDFRESPALAIAQSLTATYPGNVQCMDPFSHALETSGEDVDGLRVIESESALANADIVVALVAHAGFRQIPYPEGRSVIDACGLWS